MIFISRQNEAIGDKLIRYLNITKTQKFDRNNNFDRFDIC